MLDLRVTNLLAGWLSLTALLAGCRCENLGESDCLSSDRCNSIWIWEADPIRECQGDREFVRCERTKQAEPALAYVRLLRDDEGSYWLGNPYDVPEFEDVGEQDTSSWNRCPAAVDASVPLHENDAGE